MKRVLDLPNATGVRVRLVVSHVTHWEYFAPPVSEGVDAREARMRTTLAIYLSGGGELTCKGEDAIAVHDELAGLLEAS